MRIEHFAINVPDPQAMADWYGSHLGFQTVRTGPPPVDMRFIADDTGKVLMEIYRRQDAPMPDYAATDMLVLHIALASDDPDADARRLVDAGATMESSETTPAGDRMAVVRDPWGIALQLVKRKEPML